MILIYVFLCVFGKSVLCKVTVFDGFVQKRNYLHTYLGPIGYTVQSK